MPRAAYRARRGQATKTGRRMRERASEKTPMRSLTLVQRCSMMRWPVSCRAFLAEVLAELLRPRLRMQRTIELVTVKTCQTGAVACRHGAFRECSSETVRAGRGRPERSSKWSLVYALFRSAVCSQDAAQGYEPLVWRR